MWRDQEWRLVSGWSSNNTPAELGQDGQPAYTGYVSAAYDSVPSPRAGHAFAMNELGGGFLFGGEGDTGLLGDTWSWDSVAYAWTLRSGTGPGYVARTEAAMAGLPSALPGLYQNTFILFGGLDQYGTYRQDTYVWIDGYLTYETGWSEAAYSGTQPPGRASHALALDSNRNVVVLFGGRNGSGALGDTWELDATRPTSSMTWVQRTPAISPPAMFGHRMTFDSARGVVVLTGGTIAASGKNSKDTWEWNGTNWAKRSVPVDTDPGRVGHLSFFDGDLGETVVFGGFSYHESGTATDAYGDTSAFQGATNADPTGARYVNGVVCTADTACTSGHCVNGVCCESACAGQCSACGTPGALGKCVPVTGPPQGTRAPCTFTSAACMTTCNGADEIACHSQAGAICSPAACTSGTEAAASLCDATGDCVAGEALTCSPAGCAGTTCATSCIADAQCGSGAFCTAKEGCRPLDEITSVSVTPPIQVTVGTPVTVTAQATGVAPQFLFAVTGGTFQHPIYPCGQSYSTASSCTWNTTGEAVGNYGWLVEVTDAATVLPSEIPNNSTGISFAVVSQ